MIASVLIIMLAVSDANTELESFFARFASSRDSIEVLQAEFEQTTITPDDYVESTGTIIYTKPRRILFRYADPKIVYLADQQTVYEYDPELKQLRIDNLEDKPEAEALFMGFSENLARLQEAYTVSLVDPDDKGDAAKVVKLEPKTSSREHAYFEQVLLYLRENDFLPIRVHIINDQDSEVVYTIRNFRLNAPSDKNEAMISAPEGTTVVRGDAPSEVIGAGGKTFPEIAAPPSTAQPSPQK